MIRRRAQSALIVAVTHDADPDPIRHRSDTRIDQSIIQDLSHIRKDWRTLTRGNSATAPNRGGNVNVEGGASELNCENGKF